jgi:hypothetical protein
MLSGAAKEHGEALDAYVTASESGTRGDIDAAIRECTESIEATAALRARLEAKRDAVRMVPRAVASR